VTASVLIGLLGGMLAGMTGVGGGILFVPGLAIVAGLSQVDAEATSLVAIVPVAVVGAWRQWVYGNVRVPDAPLIGLLSVVGAVAGATLADSLPDRALRVGFALLLVFGAAQMVRRALRAAPAGGAPGGPRGPAPPGSREFPPRGSSSPQARRPAEASGDGPQGE
jgi:uncharacterized membrane protein YfcA